MHPVIDRFGKSVVIVDGGMGTLLQANGLMGGELPELWNLTHPEVLLKIQSDYVNAGCDILTANMFGANRLKLEKTGHTVQEVVSQALKLAHTASGGKAAVALDIGPSGKLLKPFGDLAFDDAYELFKEEIIAGRDNADLVIIETMSDAYEAKAALLAAKENCDLPVIVTFTFDSTGKLLTGSNIPAALLLAESLGADAVGINCSLGPEQMESFVDEMLTLTNLPIVINPNAGLPVSVNGETSYPVGPEEFYAYMERFAEKGAAILGGCCGTTPEHIRKMTHRLAGRPVPVHGNPTQRALTSERASLTFDLDGPFLIVGERINPTGKKKLQQELREGSFELVTQFAQEQEERGASILDVNMGMSGIDEKAMMLQALEEVAGVTKLPLSIDSSHVDVQEEALRRYPGRALINSISLESEKFEKLLPLAKKYGAMFVLLPLSDEGLPKNLNEKISIIEKIVARALELGMKKTDIIVDGLVATVGANKQAALETLETIRYCHRNGLATTCGLSNISFGLPERSCVNSAFLTMAIASGLTMAIANPSQDILVGAAFASDLLLNKEDSDIRYIEFSGQAKERREEADAKKEALLRQSLQASEGSTVTANQTGNTEVQDGAALQKAESTKTPQQQSAERVREAVLKGKRKIAEDLTKKALEAGNSPQELLHGQLLPAINEVGELFDKGKYFLPQLIASAETMKLCIGILEPLLLQDQTSEKMPVVVIATVAGDIHDIGKNLVALMMKNYGFQVIDLGKDVPKEKIIEAAIEHNAQIIALSALMTTTMQEMRNVVEYAKEKGVTAKIMIGGAVITQDYADEIHADGYSRDAADAVRLAKRLVGMQE